MTHHELVAALVAGLHVQIAREPHPDHAHGIPVGHRSRIHKTTKARSDETGGDVEWCLLNGPAKGPFGVVDYAWVRIEELSVAPEARA